MFLFFHEVVTITIGYCFLFHRRYQFFYFLCHQVCFGNETPLSSSRFKIVIYVTFCILSIELYVIVATEREKVRNMRKLNGI